jgi:hypothetical protein
MWNADVVVMAAVLRADAQQRQTERRCLQQQLRQTDAEKQKGKRGEISSYPGWSAGRLRVMVSDYLEILQSRLQTLGTEEEDI